MAASTTGTIFASMTFTTTNTISTGINSPVNVSLPSGSTSVGSGSLAGTIGSGWADTRNYSAAPTTFDLTTLAAAATNTGAASFAKIVGILLINNAIADSGNDITIGNAAATQFLFNGLSAATTTFVVKAGCSVLISDYSSAGMPCGVNKSLKVDPGAGTVNFTIEIIGR